MNTCTICHTAPAEKCANPHCEHYICPHHGLRYEIHDGRGLQSRWFCSRDCWNVARQRALPTVEELRMGLIALLILVALYLALVVYVLNYVLV